MPIVAGLRSCQSLSLFRPPAPHRLRRLPHNHQSLHNRMGPAVMSITSRSNYRPSMLLMEPEASITWLNETASAHSVYPRRLHQRKILLV